MRRASLLGCLFVLLATACSQEECEAPAATVPYRNETFAFTLQYPAELRVDVQRGARVLRLAGPEGGIWALEVEVEPATRRTPAAWASAQGAPFERLRVVTVGTAEGLLLRDPTGMAGPSYVFVVPQGDELLVMRSAHESVELLEGVVTTLELGIAADEVRP